MRKHKIHGYMVAVANIFPYFNICLGNTFLFMCWVNASSRKIKKKNCVHVNFLIFRLWSSNANMPKSVSNHHCLRIKLIRYILFRKRSIVGMSSVKCVEWLISPAWSVPRHIKSLGKHCDANLFYHVLWTKFAVLYEICYLNYPYKDGITQPMLND